MKSFWLAWIDCQLALKILRTVQKFKHHFDRPIRNFYLFIPFHEFNHPNFTLDVRQLFANTRSASKTKTSYHKRWQIINSKRKTQLTYQKNRKPNKVWENHYKAALRLPAKWLFGLIKFFLFLYFFIYLIFYLFSIYLRYFFGNFYKLNKELIQTYQFDSY